MRQPIFWRARQRSLVTRTGGRVPAHRCVIAPALPSFACHGEPRPCTRRGASSFRMSLQATPLQPQKHIVLLHVIANQCAHWCGNPRPRSSTNRKVVLQANTKSTTNSPKQQPTCQAFLQGYGLPRRSAPRNDSGGRPCTRRRVSVHVTMNRVLATADNCPSSACHCEPVRTLVRQSVFPAAMPGKSVVLRANSQLFRIRREELLFGLRCRRSYGLSRRFAPRNDMQNREIVLRPARQLPPHAS